MGTDNKEIAKSIKDRNDNVHGAPELVWDEERGILIAVNPDEAKRSGLPAVSETASDVFY